MNFGQGIASCFAKYVTFSGRAIRSEYWYWVLFVAIVAVVLSILDQALFDVENVSPLVAAFNVLTFLPTLAVTVRRLHDIDRSGWWILIAFTIIGGFVLFYWACKRGTLGPNRFGPDSLGAGIPVSPPRPA